MDTKPKRAPSESPALSFLLVGAKAVVVIVTILVVLIASWFAWVLYRPDHFLNPISGFAQLQMLKCREQACPVIGSLSTSMIPDVFRMGEPRDEVLSRLAEANYHLHGEDEISTIYRLDAAGTTDLRNLCSSAFFVTVSFDVSGGLTAAKSSASGYCL